MTLPRTAADVLSEHVVFELESVDRMRLNVRQPRLQYGAGVWNFFVRHRGWRFASTALMAPMTDDALARGYVVLFLSPEALDAVEAEFVVAEIEHAVARAAATGKSSKVVPVLVSDREHTLDLLASSPAGEAVGQMQMVDFTLGDFDDNFAELLRILVK